ncbi:MAG TPA: tetratricopeptide repeat protein [Verrucomicrobiae bacterium]|nr:tetratricopeptide repeat protein [Verrucomicrobiae bacterium]
MRTRTSFILFALSWLWCFGVGTAMAQDSAGAAFDSANRLYEQGKYSEAAAGYEKLVQAGHRSAAVYFNLGNACFKAGEIGKAIAAYHEAERITPRDPDLLANLQFARNQVQGPTFTPPAWHRWLSRLSLNEWSWLACVVVWLFFVLLIIMEWRPALKRPLRIYAMLLGVVLVLLVGLTGAAWNENQPGRDGVVMSKEATVRQGPLEESQTAFTLHDGAEVQVLDRKDDWLQITTGPRSIGWLKREQVALGTKI